MSTEPFRIPLFEREIADLNERLARTRWPEGFPDPAWEYGFDAGRLREICRYWREEFDWARRVERLARFDHYRFVSRDGAGIHFIHARGEGANRVPLILTHGWPGSFVEMLAIIPLLTRSEDGMSFDVVVPSLPGFGFSDKVSMNVFGVANLWVELMLDLGYTRFGAQGGDIGAGVSTALGLRHPDRLTGIHLNYIPGSYRPYVAAGAEITPVEKSAFARRTEWADESGAYGHLQSTRPLTAAYGVNDSPAALAAWILEKFREWSDSDLPIDDLLTNVTLYWLTGTIGSSFRMYFENRQAPLRLQEGELVKPPCAVAHFPREIPIPARESVARGYNLRRWTEMPRGGHFAAMEEPELLAADIRTFFKEEAET